MKRLSGLMTVAAIVIALVTAACNTGNAVPPSQKGPVTVASKIDTEGSLLAQMIIAMLKGTGFQAVDKSGLGPTQVVRQALLSGQVDVYPEYTGNGAFFFPNSDQTVWRDAQKGYDAVKKLDKDANNIVWLSPAPANNTWAVAVPAALAAKENLKSLDDLVAEVVRAIGYEWSKAQTVTIK